MLDKKKEFIIVLSSYHYNNIIFDSKKKTNESLIEDFFLNQLYKLSKNFENISIINIDKFFANYGYDDCFNERNYTLFRSRLSLLGLEILSKKFLKF